MKKIFFSLLAIAAIASCAKTEAVYEEGQVEIKLSPVTALQTKAKVTGAVDGTTYPTGENFDVFAYWSKDDNGMFTDGELFLKNLYNNGGAEFTNKGNYWGGTVKYYWPKNGYLRFAAYSPADLTVEHQQVGDVYSIKPYVQEYETAKTWDFLVAKTSPAYSVMTATEKVAVEFEHALSWITLKVKAKDADAAQAFDIKRVTIKDIYTAADFEATMVDGMPVDPTEADYPWTNWTAAKDYVVFEGSQMVTETLTDIENTPAGTVIIPQSTTKVVVEFDQYGVNGTADTPGMTVELDLVLDTDNTPWVPGKHYNYNLIFGLDEILINPSVVDWDEVNVGNLEPGAINVSTAAQLEAALANPQATKIVFQNDIAGTFNVPEAAKSLTIDGNGFKFDGSFCLVGNSSYTNSYTVFKNLKFTAEGAALTGDAFIYCAEQNGNTRYPDNVTIQDCTYEAAGQTAVGVKLRSLNGALVIENTTATGLHSLAQILSSGAAEAKINNVNVTDCKNGISLQYTSATISNSTIKAAEYGVRADGANATLTVIESTINAVKPIIVRNLTAGTYNVVLEDATLVPGQDFAVVFTKNSDDVAFVTPTGNFTIKGAKPADNIFPQTATTKEAFEAALADASVDVIGLGADITYANTEAVSIEKNVTINANGNKIGAGGAKSLTPSVAVSGDYDVVLNDAAIEGGFVGAYYGANVTVNGGSLKFTEGESGRNCFYAASTTTEAAVITINDVDVNMANASGNSYLCAHGNATIFVKGGKFYGKPVGSSNAYVKEASINGYTGKVVITGGTFNFDPSAWVPAGYTAVKNGSEWTVSKN